VEIISKTSKGGRSLFLSFRSAFLTKTKECIPTREVTIRTDDRMWFDSNLRRVSLKSVFKN
jgi:hypothetical protein